MFVNAIFDYFYFTIYEDLEFHKFQTPKYSHLET